MQITFCIVILVIIASCERPSSSPVLNGIPETQVTGLCDEVNGIKGGNLTLLADRVVVGQITAIEFIDELTTLANHNVEDCTDESYAWSMQVTIDVEHNLKGEGETLTIGVSPFTSVLGKQTHEINRRPVASGT